MQVTVKPDVADDETTSSIRAVTTRSQSKQNAEPPSGCNSESMKENVWASDQDKVKVRSFQEKDPDLSTILKALEAGQKPAHRDIVALSPAARYYWSIWDSLTLKDGCVHRHFYRKDATGSHLQFVVPRHLKDKILYQVHNTIISGHLGRKKTEKLLQRFFWYEMM